MIRRIPIISTLVVLTAALTMVMLGFWQLGRADWKNEKIAHYAAAQNVNEPVDWPRTAADIESALYRRSAFTCQSVLERRDTSGRSASGKNGWAHMALCALDGGGEAEVALGWSADPSPQFVWAGGEVTGFIAPAGDGARLVAKPAQAGLEPLTRPDPSDLPNNHLAYAVQWFLFALIALVIYALALRWKWRGEDADAP